MPDNKIKIGEEIHGFKLLKTEDIPEIKFTGNIDDNGNHNAYEYVHTSGAKLLHLENEDPELAFTIGFKTLPKDSTGVFHILEHSVLCGSKKFPVKEPFTNLLKSSMQTFLNAMTFPDKTIYPVASTNEKDFYNLVDVYMDAVLYPNIYKNKNIFYQEGGHKTPEGFSGVVFNEMSGVYSDPQEHIFEGLMQQLFPDSCYAYSSGGAPEVIKKLTYEEYLAQHNTNYCLTNAYIIVYGNLDIKKMFKFLNDNYLSRENELKEWRGSTPVTSQGKWENNYSFEAHSKPIFREVATAKENAECGAGFVVKRDHRQLAATRILLNTIAGSNESPLKKALLDENFCADIDFDMLSEVYEPFIIVECKSSKKDASKNLLKLISDKVTQIAECGISKDMLQASISNIEFKLKEKLPDCTNGLDYSICAMSEWLYDSDASTSALKYLDDIKWLKEQVKTDYFEKLAKEIFVENKHVAVVEVVPVEKTETKKPNYSDEEQKKIIELCQNLVKWQATPDSKEDEAKIPVMSIDDIGEMPKMTKRTVEEKDTTLVKYDINTNGITYVNRYYPLNEFDGEDIHIISMLTELLGKLDTEKYSSEEIDVIAREKLGRLGFRCAFFEKFDNPNNLDLRLAIRSAALDENSKYLASLIDEIIFRTKFEDSDKIFKILKQKQVSLEQCFIAAGHSAALNNAASRILPVYKMSEMASGVAYYLYLKQTLNTWEKSKDNLIKKLQDLSADVFNCKPIITYAGTNECISQITIGEKDAKAMANVSIDEAKDSAFIIPGDVNYCAMVNDLRLNNEKMDGTKVASSKIVALDYLWNNVRVKNGAYGAGMIASPRGTIQFYSFRDPQIQKTFENFENSTKWLSELELDKQSLDNYIISSVAKIDAPSSAIAKIQIMDVYYFSDIDLGLIEKNRNQIIHTTLDDVHEAGRVFAKLAKNSSKCVFGTKALNNCSDQFNIVDLFSV